MKIRMIALAGVAALALSGPALAGEATGWYVDLSGGYDHMGQFTVHNNTTLTETKVGTDNSALVTGAWGYKFHDHIRLEGEIGWDDHDVTSGGGHASIKSFLLNVAYDVPLAPKWDFSFGAGAGTGIADVEATVPGILVNDSHAGYMYQGFAGFAYSLRRNIDITFDWRYRDLALNKNFDQQPGVKIKDTNEQAWMIGIRWYPWYAPLPPAPPPPPPPPPAPPPLATAPTMAQAVAPPRAPLVLSLQEVTALKAFTGAPP